MAGNTGDTDDNDEAKSVETDENGLPTEAGLLAAIPKTTEEQNYARKRIQDAYIDLSGAYIKDLEDYAKGTHTLDTFEYRFPSNDHKAEVLYLRYQIALNQNRLDEAQSLSEQLRKDYSETKWAKELTPKENTKGLLASTVPVANYYDETYGLMIQRQYSDVLQRVREGQKQYSDPVYNKRFRIMEAIALAGVGNYDQADTLLTEFIRAKPSDSLRSWADAILNYVKKNKPDSSAANTIAPANGQPPSAPSAGGTAINTNTPQLSAYTSKPASEHYFIFQFNKMESRAMGVKAGLNDFNTFNFASQSLSVSINMLKQNEGIIIVKAFPSAAHAKIYMNAVKGNKQLLKEYKPEEYSLLLISADNFKKLNAEKDMAAYIKFYKANYK